MGAVIASFKDVDTAALFQRQPVGRWSTSVQKAARKKLVMIDSASDIRDLTVPPGNRLERLAGDRAGQYSIRVNDQWRICFRWQSGNAYEVEIVDYH